jgi:hypothetical protein
VTPEGKIKSKIAKVIDKYEGSIYVYMPVPGGFGKPTLDYLGFLYGRGFAIEAKRPGKAPTLRQEGTIEDIRASGTPVFVINDDASLEVFATWLETIKATLELRG